MCSAPVRSLWCISHLGPPKGRVTNTHPTPGRGQPACTAHPEPVGSRAGPGSRLHSAQPRWGHASGVSWPVVTSHLVPDGLGEHGLFLLYVTPRLPRKTVEEAGAPQSPEHCTWDQHMATFSQAQPPTRSVHMDGRGTSVCAQHVAEGSGAETGAVCATGLCHCWG